MNVTIIGSGAVGSVLARRLHETGHKISVGVRNKISEKSRKFALAHPSIDLLSIEEAIQRSNVIIVSIRVDGFTSDFLQQLGSCTGKIIIDSTNTVGSKPEAPYSNGFEALVGLLPGAAVVKCFNTVGWESMDSPNFGSQTLDMFMAGGSSEAKEVARKLALDIGFAECYDFGDEHRVSLLEQLALAWINLAIFQGVGRDTAFKLLKR